MTPRLPAARRRRQLLGVALQVFAERGYHDASMNDIADAAGVTKPVLYQHFRSKRELFAELLADCGQDLQEAITKAVTTAASSHQMVELGFAAYFRYVEQHRDAFNLFYGIGAARDDEFATMVQRVSDTIAELVAGFIDIAGLGAEQRRLLSHGIVGMIVGTSTHWLQSGATTDAAVVAHQLADLAWRGLRGVQPESSEAAPAAAPVS